MYDLAASYGAAGTGLWNVGPQVVDTYDVGPRFPQTFDVVRSRTRTAEQGW